MPLLSLRDAIITAWEAATPPNYDTRSYRHVEKSGSGSSFHRAFWFRDPKGGAPRSQDSTRYGIDHQFEAVVGLHIPDRTTSEFEWPYREYQVLAPLVKSIRIGRVQAPRVSDWFLERIGDEGDFDLVLVITARTKEQS
jgi:hypothetical protein